METSSEFPFLELPNELISHIFSFLPIEDRMRARVNKRLDTIELESKYYLDELVIEEQSTDSPLPGYSYWNEIIFREDSSYSSECIRRISQNASIGILFIKLSGSNEFHREVCHLINNFDIDTLHIDFKNKDADDKFLMSSPFHDLAKSCKYIQIPNRLDTLTAMDLHDLYNIMMTGSTKLQTVLLRIEKFQCMYFLIRIGIAYRDGIFYSNRGVELYVHVTHFVLLKVRFFHIFDGNLEITLSDRIFARGFEKGKMQLKLHENRESLEEAKKEGGLIRINFDGM